MSRTAAKPTRERISKTALTVAQAADVWEDARRETDRLKPILEESAAVLLEHFQRTGRATYKDRIAVVSVAPKLVLDQAKVREFLAERLGDFQRRTEPGRSLTLLR